MTRRFATLAGMLACTLFVAGNASAQFDATAVPTNDAGYLEGDPSAGKVVPFYEFTAGRCDNNNNGQIDPIEDVVSNDCGDAKPCATGSECIGADKELATIVGFMNTRLNPIGRDDIFVHIEVFDTRSNPQFSKTICLTQGDFGFLVLQQSAANQAQLDEKNNRCGPNSAHGFKADPDCKVTFLSQEIEGITSHGYVTFAARRPLPNPDNDQDFACEFGADFETSETADQDNPPGFFAWSILQDVSEGFFGVEIPTQSAGVNFRIGSPGGVGNSQNEEPCGRDSNGRKVSALAGDPISDAPAGTACLVDTSHNGSDAVFGLISGDRRVGARYDCNPANASATRVILWSQNNLDLVEPIIARGEDEGCFDGSINIPDEVNIITACSVSPVASLANSGEFRGTIEFITPGTDRIDGYVLFSLISQETDNFVLSQRGYQTGFDTVNDATSLQCPTN